MSEHDGIPLPSDPYNSMEHALREHVREAKALWELNFPNYSGMLYILYKADDQKWRITTYTPDITTQGAELMLVMHAHIASHRAQADIATLRGMLTYQPEDNDNHT